MDLQSQWQDVVLWASILSLLAGVLTLIAVPWVITRLPADYFSCPSRAIWRRQSKRPALALVVTVLKNVLGLLLAVLGVIMLLTPGQGLLTLLVGLMLMNFPGKYHLERWLVARPGVLRALNWLRRKRGREPFAVPVA